MDFRIETSSRVGQSWRRLKAATVSGVYTLTKYCITCKNLRLSHAIHFRRPDAKASASPGCPYCIFILNALEHFSTISANEDKNLIILFGAGGRYFLRTCMFDHEEMYGLGLQLELYTPAGHPPAWPGIFQGVNILDALLSGSPQTSETYEFIRSCLRDCDANHPKCKIAGLDHLPTRLLDVQLEGAPQVILVETASLPLGHRTTYIALSYCWGKGQSLTLRSENLEAMKLGLTVSSLPQTLQDAITVTRALGQQYLWIDALCIIQDSSSDWEVESSRMASVYRGAYLTIAAATASDVTQGFLPRNYRETNGWYKEPYQEEWINHETRSTILGARMSIKYNGHWDDDVQAPVPPWNLRGWVLQEQLLSRRLLIYHAYELRWVCQNGATCQCSLKLKLGSNSSRDPLDKSILSFTSAATAHRHWGHIIGDYTARKLSDPRDKLPALSGLAKHFQQVIQSPYIAGLWAKHLSSDLLWETRADEVGYASERYIGPSFSWASISSPVYTRNMLAISSADEWVAQTVIEDTCSIVDGKDPLGRVNNGWIKLRGYIFKAALVDHSERQREYLAKTKYLGEKYFAHDTWLEEFEAKNQQGNVEVSVRRSRGHSSITPQDNKPSRPGIQRGAVVYLFLIGHDTTFMRVKSYFLVLGLSWDKPGMYERLGLLQHGKETESQSEWDNYISSLITAADEHKVITIV